MSRKTNRLPYFNRPLGANNIPWDNFERMNKSSQIQEEREKEAADFLLRKFVPIIRREMPYHYLVYPMPRKKLSFIKENSKRYPYFLRFDIKKYFPSINHQTLLQQIPENYQKITKKPLSKRFKKYLKDTVPSYLLQSPYNRGIPTGSKLSYALSGIYLLCLDIDIPAPFLRQTDDYIVFCKTENDPSSLLKNIITPQLEKLDLEVNEKKLSSGKFHKNRVDFIGFDFYAGYFSVNGEKKAKFKQKITENTHLTKKKPEKAVIKVLNNKILGFGHYYKHTSCKEDFKKLDAYVRMRFRRYLTRNKDSKSKEGNLYLSNYQIKNLGLKSLINIKEEYDNKKGPILERISKKHRQRRRKKGVKRPGTFTKALEIEFKYQQKLVLEELREITVLLIKLKKQIKQNKQELLIKREMSADRNCLQVSINLYYISIVFLLTSVITLLFIITFGG